jgi:hypothetical protein
MFTNVIPDGDLAALRFKILHLIIADSNRSEVSVRIKSKVEHVHAQVAKYIP